MGHKTMYFKAQAMQGSVEESFITGGLKEGKECVPWGASPLES